jgi:hypothetical protein
MPFMSELCSAKEHTFRGYDGEQAPQTFMHNQITILESTLKSINPDDREHELYRYGDDAVMQLDLVCEYVFYKAGYDPFKPSSIKEQPGETDDTATIPAVPAQRTSPSRRAAPSDADELY